jgi:hypothetical protein
VTRVRAYARDVVKRRRPAAFGAAATSEQDEGSSRQWRWIAFGVLAAAVAIVGIVLWLRSGSG